MSKVNLQTSACKKICIFLFLNMVECKKAEVIGYMRRFFNPDNACFKRTIESEIYVDKTELIEYINHILNTE